MPRRHRLRPPELAAATPDAPAGETSAASMSETSAASASEAPAASVSDTPPASAREAPDASVERRHPTASASAPSPAFAAPSAEHPPTAPPAASALFPQAAVEPPSPDVAPVEAESALPGMHRGGFERWPTAPVGVMPIPSAPDLDAPVQWAAVEPTAPTRGMAAWALGFAIAALVVSLVRRLGVPDRSRRDRDRDHRAASPARKPRRRGMGARPGYGLRAVQRGVAALRGKPHRPARLTRLRSTPGRRGSRVASSRRG